MFKYFKINWIIFKNAYIRDMKIPGQIFSKILFQLVEIIITIVFFDIIFSNTKTLAGWNFYQVLFLYAFSMFIIAVTNAWTRGGLKQMAAELVRRGDYDFYLTKPVNPMILVSISKPRIYQFIGALFDLGLCAYAILAGNITITLSNLIWFLVIAFFGFILYYFLVVLTVVPAFWFVRLFALQDLMGRMNQFMRYPLGVFPPFIRVALMTAFPIIAVAFLPTQALFGEIKIEYIVYIILLTIFFALITNFIWKQGEKRYSSASS